MDAEFQQPLWSDIKVEDAGGALRVRVPRAGFGPRTYWMVPFLTFFLALFVAALFLVKPFASISTTESAIVPVGEFLNWLPLGLDLLSLIVTAVCLAVVVHYAMREVELEVRFGTLTVRVIGPLGVRTREVPVDRVRWFAVGINRYVRTWRGRTLFYHVAYPFYARTSPVPQFQIALEDEPQPIRFGTGRPDEELKWLAFTLNKALGKKLPDL
jgi:hypothetical protein